MNNYLDYLKSIEMMFGTYCEVMKNIAFTKPWLLIFIIGLELMLVVITGNFLVRASKGYSTRAGNMVFWVVLSILTFGVGGIIGRVLMAISGQKLRCRRSGAWLYIFIPSVVVFTVDKIIKNTLTGDGLGISDVLCIGLIVLVFEVLIILILPINRPLSIDLSGFDKKYSNYVRDIVADCSLRRKMRKPKKGLVKVKVRKIEVPLKVVSSSELDKFSLASEKFDDFMVRKYRKPNGETFEIMEIEGLVTTKIFSAVTGLLIMLALFTPYILYSLASVIVLLRGGVL